MTMRWQNPAVTDTYTNWESYIQQNFAAVAKLLDGETLTGTTPTGAKRYNATSQLFESWSGTAWTEMSLAYVKTSVYTASDVLAKLLTVDGAGSALDADLLDGQHGSYYTNAANLTGTLADARLSSNVPLKNASNTFTATQTISSGASSILTLNASSSPQLRFENTGATANNRNWIVYTDSASFQVRPYSDDYSSSTAALSIARSGSAAGAMQTYGNLFVGANQSGVGYISMQTGNAAGTGYTSFYNSSGGREGYIGFATTTGGSDTGTIPYVAGWHAFTGFMSVSKRAYVTPTSVAFSSTPTFDSSASNTIYFGTMTANVTSSTISNAVDGAELNIRVQQDATGGRTFALPSNVQVSGNLNTAANAVTWLVVKYVSSASRWEGTWTRVS